MDGLGKIGVQIASILHPNLYYIEVQVYYLLYCHDLRQIEVRKKYQVKIMLFRKSNQCKCNKLLSYG